MQTSRHGWLVLLLSSSVQAEIYRCTAADGHITFSDSHCEQQQLEQPLDTPRVNSIRPPATPERAEASNGLRVLVTGQRSDGCGDVLSSSERRQLVIRQQIRHGMSSADVERALGKPDRISNSKKQTRYHYLARGGQPAQTVAIDESGCVVSTR